MIYSFAPIASKNSRILILGSMPSVRSLEMGQYYAHQQNAFWPILFELFDLPYSDDYEKKRQLILNHHLALWDVLASCERQGSLDSNITDEKANDFVNFFEEYDQIQYILFNGGKAEASFKKHFPQFYQSKKHYKMPSTSPAHTMKRQTKAEKWQLLLELLDKCLVDEKEGENKNQ